MEFWGKKINVSKEAAQIQVDIIKTFSSEKRAKIALDVANFGIMQTRKWIKSNHPTFCEEEVTLEFIRLMHYKRGKLTAEAWEHIQKVMAERIKLAKAKTSLSKQ